MTHYTNDPDYQDWLNDLLVNAGDEWDDDVAMEEIAVRYVRWHEAEVERLRAERDAWKQAALLYRSIAADGVLRLKSGLSYAQAQDRYDKALAAEPGGSQATSSPDTP